MIKRSREFFERGAWREHSSVFIRVLLRLRRVVDCGVELATDVIQSGAAVFTIGSP